MRQLLQANGYKNREVAKALELSDTQVSRALSGESPKNLAKIGVWFFQGEDHNTGGNSFEDVFPIEGPRAIGKTKSLEELYEQAIALLTEIEKRQIDE